MAAMTKQEFIDYWLKPDEHGRNLLSYNEESIGEHECQFLSESAMFGDAGPGQGIGLQQMKAEHAKVVERLIQFGAM